MKLGSVLIGSEDPKGLTQFYTGLFGEPAMQEGGFTAWQVGDAWLTVGPHDEVHGKNSEPGRLIWNLETADVKGDFERFRTAGASVVKEPYGPGDSDQYLIATLSDPDNNFFQLVSPMSADAAS